MIEKWPRRSWISGAGTAIAALALGSKHVCDMATHMISGVVAGAVKGNADAIYQELVSNRIPNSHMVAAGVLAVNRAQEYGYTLLSAG